MSKFQCLMQMWQFILTSKRIDLCQLSAYLLVKQVRLTSKKLIKSIPMECLEVHIPPTTHRAQALCSILSKIKYLQIVLAIPKAVISIPQALLDTLGALTIDLAVQQLNGCLAAIATLMNVCNLLMTLFYLGSLVQVGNDPLKVWSIVTIIRLVAPALSIIYYVVAIYCTTEAYKEFTAITCELKAEIQPSNTLNGIKFDFTSSHKFS